jgi:hypothetical protein
VEPQLGLHHQHVDPALEHNRVAGERGAPQLGHAGVHVGQVVGVEYDPLGIALGVPDPQGMREGLGHGSG